MFFFPFPQMKLIFNIFLNSFRNGVEMVYDGERKKEALVDFAMKASGPIVSMIDSGEDFSKVRSLINVILSERYSCML